MRLTASQPQDPRHPNMRPTSRGQSLRVGHDSSRTGTVLNRGKKEAMGCSSGNPDRCYKCRGIDHQSKVCLTCREHALFLDVVEEVVQRDQ